MGAFLVFESSDHAKARGAKPRARVSQCCPIRNARKGGEAEASLRRQWNAITPQLDRSHAAVISGASGFEPATSSERSVLKEVGFPVRNTGTYIGHGVDTQFMADLGIGCAAIEHGKLFAPRVGRYRGKSARSVPNRRHQRRQLARRRAGAARRVS